jgi:hypothetical protein
MTKDISKIFTLGEAVSWDFQLSIFKKIEYPGLSQINTLKYLWILFYIRQDICDYQVWFCALRYIAGSKFLIR